MNYVNKIALLLTEDPDVFHKNVVIAVHPNYVIDAVVFASKDEDYGPKRLQMLRNYIDRFKRFIDGQINNGSTIIITMMGTPFQLETWYDPGNHYEDKEHVDLEKIGMEQEEVLALHQDIVDYIYEKGSLSNVFVVNEETAGEAFQTGRLDDILQGVDEINIIGGHKTGCLDNTKEILEKREGGPKVNYITELIFDDDKDFWGRASSDLFN